MTRTFVDACVLIAAARGDHQVHEEAMAVLEDPKREFVASDFLRLEVLPKPLYNGYEAEAEFYKVFFSAAVDWAKTDEGLLADAYDEAVRNGLSAVDALHVVGAAAKGASELVTAERRTSPLLRSSTVKVVSIRPTSPDEGEQ
ncbi:MAG: type II toxin-antitoxin system VapC family toxin [Deferrisomatales bacterium]